MTELIGLLAALGAGLVFWWIVARRESPEEAAIETTGEATATPETPVRRDARTVLSAVAQMLAKPAMRGKRSAELQARLSALGTGLKPHEFWVLQVLAAAFLAFLSFARFGNVLAGIPAGFVGYFIPLVWLRRRETKRRRAIEGQLADVINLLANALKAGHSTQQALATVAEAGREPLGSELRRVIRELQLGLELDVALQNVNKRLQSQDFDMVVTAVIIHRRVGGNLANVLDKISHTVRERVKIHGEVRVLTAQARASGYIVTGLPFAVAVLLTVVSPDFELPLFRTTLGWAMLVVGTISLSIGYAIIRKISDIKL
jgi:tight adherence protein B